ncbi:MAG: glycosyltransferase family 39 protein [Crocinitomicaceae bacterium]
MKRNLDIIIIILIGFGLRFTISVTHSYSNDELSAIKRLEYTNFSDLIEHGVKTGDMHPAGVQVFMKAWSAIGGLNEGWMRFPFVLCGVLSIWVIFLIGNRWLNRSVGLIAAMFLSLLYFPIMNSEFARPYSPALLFSLLSAYFYLKLLFSNERTYRDAVFLGLSVVAAMYCHYFALLFVGWLCLSGLIFLKRSHLTYFLTAAVIVILLYAPHIPITQYHLGVGGLQWLGPPNNLWLLDFLFYAFNASVLLLSVILAFLLLSIVMRDETIEQKNPRVYALFAIWFFGIYLIGHIFSLYSTPVLKFPVMLFAFPFLLLLLAGVLSRFRFQKFLLFVLMITTGASTIVEKDLYGNMHYELFKEVAQKIVKWNKAFGEDDIVTIYNINNPDYMNFYANQWGDTIDFDIDELEFGDAPKVRNHLMKTKKPYCIVGYSARLTLHQVFECCREFYPFIVDYKKYNNAAVFLLSRYPNDENYTLKNELIQKFEPGKNMDGWEYEETGLQIWTDTILNESKPAYVLEGERIYGPTLKIRAGEIANYEEKYMKIIVEGQIPVDGQLTASVSAERDGQAIYNRDEVFWLGFDVEEMLYETGTGYFAFRIPDFIAPDDVLKISFWNRNAEVPVYLFKAQLKSIENVWN